MLIIIEETFIGLETFYYRITQMGIARRKMATYFCDIVFTLIYLLTNKTDFKK